VAEFPDRVDGGRVVLRRWRPEHEEALTAAVACSAKALWAWVPHSAHELADPPRFLAAMVTEFDAGSGFGFAIFDGDELVGSCNLVWRAGDWAEIGYWVRTDRENRGYATEAVRALSSAGFAVLEGLERIELHCDANNVASARVASKAGYEHVDTRAHTAVTETQSEREVIWLRSRNRSARS
jgi:RimJ/RimL family protein N-acetyltransferase